MRVRLVALVFALTIPGCDCGGAPGGDDDGDGGAPNADANCSLGPFSGCACDPATAEVQPCYTGPTGTSGNEPCMKGTMTCLTGSNTWGACDGEVVPHEEACDNVDNDCDGDTDEAGCQDVSVGD